MARRKRTVGLVIGGAVSLFTLLVACSGDDSDPTGQDSGIDVVLDTYAPTRDVNLDHAAADGPCQLCGAIESTTENFLCTNNGPPSSADLANTLFNCFCGASNPCSGGACQGTCLSGFAPNAACAACISAQCPTELNQCLNDTGNGIADSGVDAPADGPHDAGDAG